MDNLLVALVNIAAGIGSLVCFVIVVIHFFQSDQQGLGIACIVLLFVCGIGGLVAFVKGWMDGLGTVMYVWTACLGWASRPTCCSGRLRSNGVVAVVACHPAEAV
jgi:hypothetical protein